MMLPEADADSGSPRAARAEAAQQQQEEHLYRRQRWRWVAGLVVGVALVAVGLALLGGGGVAGGVTAKDIGVQGAGEQPAPPIPVVTTQVGGTDAEEENLSKQATTAPAAPRANTTTTTPPPSTAKPPPSKSAAQLIKDTAADLLSGKATVTEDFWGAEIPGAGDGGTEEADETLTWEEFEAEGQHVDVDEVRSVCFVENAVELRRAIDHETCRFVQLADESNDLGDQEQDKVRGLRVFLGGGWGGAGRCFSLLWCVGGGGVHSSISSFPPIHPHQQQDDDDPQPPGEVNDSRAKIGAYTLFKELEIRRTLTIQGDAVIMPLIDCEESVRCMRVHVGKWGMGFCHVEGKDVPCPGGGKEGRGDMV